MKGEKDLNFADKLIYKIKEMNNPTVMGLDPKLEFIPKFIKEGKFTKYKDVQIATAESIIEFNKGLIDSIADIIPAVKPQLAYYEMYGIEGIRAFKETVKYAKEKGLIVIADAKRNDIGSTSEAYANAFLGETKITDTINEIMFDADALTVNGYLGIDGIKPFIETGKKFGKGIFILVKTSNPSSGQLQDLILEDGRTVYEAMAELVDEWGASDIGTSGYSSVGAVVGATYPEQAKRLRKVMKKTIFLVPGYGAQGGTAKDASNSFNTDGLGAIINASRSLMCAYKSEKWCKDYSDIQYKEACRAEAERMRNDINLALNKEKN